MLLNPYRTESVHFGGGFMNSATKLNTWAFKYFLYRDFAAQVYKDNLRVMVDSLEGWYRGGIPTGPR